MYVDISTVSYDSKSNTATITCLDLDNILLQNWDQDLTEKGEVTFKFDLTAKGPRIYLYKLIKSQVKEEYSTMQDGLMKLAGKITNISANFLEKAEG